MCRGDGEHSAVRQPDQLTAVPADADRPDRADAGEIDEAARAPKLVESSDRAHAELVGLRRLLQCHQQPKGAGGHEAGEEQTHTDGSCGPNEVVCVPAHRKWSGMVTTAAASSDGLTTRRARSSQRLRPTTARPQKTGRAS